VLVPANVRHVPDSQIRGRPRCTLVVATENDLHVGPKLRPALDRVALNHGGVADESLGNGEEGEERHRRSLT